MYTKIPEEFTTTIKPFNSLLEINTKSVERLINLQKKCFTAIGWEVAAQTKTLSTQTDMTKVMDEQKYYSEQLQEKVSNSVKDVCNVASQSSEEVAHLVQDSISQVVNAAK